MEDAAAAADRSLRSSAAPSDGRRSVAGTATPTVAATAADATATRDASVQTEESAHEATITALVAENQTLMRKLAKAVRSQATPPPTPCVAPPPTADENAAAVVAAVAPAIDAALAAANERAAALVAAATGDALRRFADEAAARAAALRVPCGTCADLRAEIDALRAQLAESTQRELRLQAKLMEMAQRSTAPPAGGGGAASPQSARAPDGRAPGAAAGSAPPQVTRLTMNLRPNAHGEVLVTPRPH